MILLIYENMTFPFGGKGGKTIRQPGTYLIRGLEDIFAPMVAHDMPADDLEALIREPATTQRERTYRADLVHKLEEGQKVLKEVMGGRHSDPQVFARQS